VVGADVAGRRQLRVGAAAEIGVGSSSVISRSPGWRANSSSAFMSSHGSVFSPLRGPMRTRCQRPLSRVPSSKKARCPFCRPRCGSAYGIQRPPIPDDHGATTIFALRDVALEIEIIDRVILGADRQPFLSERQARAPCRHPPSFSARHRARAADRVQPAGGMHLHDEFMAVRRAGGYAGFRGSAEVALLRVFFRAPRVRVCV